MGIGDRKWGNGEMGKWGNGRIQLKPQNLTPKTQNPTPNTPTQSNNKSIIKQIFHDMDKIGN
jgi:hypothetical protein